MPYPMSTSGLRRPTRSEITPEKTLAIESVASARPSMKSTDIADAPNTVTRNTGRRLWILSEEMSMVRLTRLSATTPWAVIYAHSSSFLLTAASRHLADAFAEMQQGTDEEHQADDGQR